MACMPPFWSISLCKATSPLNTAQSARPTPERRRFAYPAGNARRAACLSERAQGVPAGAGPALRLQRLARLPFGACPCVKLQARCTRCCPHGALPKGSVLPARPGMPAGWRASLNGRRASRRGQAPRRCMRQAPQAWLSCAAAAARAVPFPPCAGCCAALFQNAQKGRMPYSAQSARFFPAPAGSRRRARPCAGSGRFFHGPSSGRAGRFYRQSRGPGFQSRGRASACILFYTPVLGFGFCPASAAGAGAGAAGVGDGVGCGATSAS